MAKQQEAIKGADRILLFRKLGEKSSAVKLMFQTEHSTDRSKDGGDSVATKDGPITAPGTSTIEVPFSSIMARDDSAYDVLLNCYYDDSVVEVWEIDKGAEATKDGSGSTKYPATYMQGKISEFSETANAEDSVEISGTISVNGRPQKGMATLSDKQAEVVQYAFEDTTEKTEVGE